MATKKKHRDMLREDESSVGDAGKLFSAVIVPMLIVGMFWAATEE